MALKILTFFNSPFAIRSGGHQVAPGFSNIDNGVLLDMSKLNGITYIKGQQTVVIGTGALWGAVYEKLEPYGVTVVGGRVNGVGVGGLILGSMISVSEVSCYARFLIYDFRRSILLVEQVWNGLR